ncbi:MAG: hypothetical protein ABIK12_10800 [Pseudomonadota bacterium]
MKKVALILVVCLALAAPALAGDKPAPPAQPTAQQLQQAIAQRQQQIRQISGKIRELELMRLGLATEARQLQGQLQAPQGKKGK